MMISATVKTTEMSSGGVGKRAVLRAVFSRLFCTLSKMEWWCSLMAPTKHTLTLSAETVPLHVASNFE